MNARKTLLIGFSLAITALITIIVMLYLTKDKHEELYQSQLNRYSSYLLADELRQSSDDLTRMARTYVITQNEKYEKMYWDILAIRNGELPRPEAMQQIYWDLVLNYGDKPRPDTQAVSLHDLMVHAGFTLREFSMLKEAQDFSDSLVKTETAAMNAVKGLFDDGSGNFVVRAEPDIRMAIQIMHDELYHQDKADIMRPVNEFFTYLDKRTAQKVNTQKQEVALYENLLLVCVIIAFVVIFIASLIVYRGFGLMRKGN